MKAMIPVTAFWRKEKQWVCSLILLMYLVNVSPQLTNDNGIEMLIQIAREEAEKELEAYNSDLEAGIDSDKIIQAAIARQRKMARKLAAAVATDEQIHADNCRCDEKDYSNYYQQ